MTRLQQLIDAIGEGINTTKDLADFTGLQVQSVDRYLRRPEAREVVGRRDDRSYHLLAANEEDFDLTPAFESPVLKDLPDEKEIEIWDILKKDFRTEAELRQTYREYDMEYFIDYLTMDCELVCIDRDGQKYFCDMNPGSSTLAVSRRYNRYFAPNPESDYWQEV